jgi:hypothetical protein
MKDWSATKWQSTFIGQETMHSAASVSWVPSCKIMEQIEEVMFNLGLGAAGRDYIKACLQNGPSRRVQHHRGNSLIRFTSATLGIQVMLESRRGEHPLAILADADEKTICFFAQPPRLSLEIKDENGVVKTTTTYTPDLLVIRSDGIFAQQARDLTALSDQCLKNPYQFFIDEEGQWHYRAADDALAAMGIQHQIIANSSIPSTLVRNLRFLEDYTREGCLELDPTVAESLAAFIQARRFIPFHGLVADGGFSADDINKAILSRLVYVDLTTDLLDATSDLVIFSDAATHAAHRRITSQELEAPLPIPGTMWIKSGARITYDKKSLRVVLVGERDVVVMDEHGMTSTLPLQALEQLHQAGMLEAEGFVPNVNVGQLADCSPEALARAVKRLDAVDDPTNSAYSARSITDYRARVAMAPNRLEALVALVDKQVERGNRVSRISEENLDFAKKAIGGRYNTPEVPSKKAAYYTYLELISGRKEISGQLIRPVSYQTFCKWCGEQESVLQRRGKRANYQHAAIVQSLDNAYPVHGVRPHEICYIDHTVANMATVSPNGVELGKPTLTVARDGNTTQARALILTYDPASTKTVVLVLRDYVRRWRRLPRVISVDNGKEFHSAELSFLCHIFGIEIRYRPPAMPRGGSPIERILGATEEEVFGQLQGNTRQMKDPRLVTKSVNPFNRAIWTLTALYKTIDEYLFEVRPNRVSPALGMTPNAYEALREAETGVREHLLVRFDENLMLMTSPHARKRFHKVDARRGVWVDGFWYQHQELRSVRKDIKVEVRVEPWLHQVVYVLVGKRWITATASNARQLGNLSRREVEIAYREEKRLAERNANKATLSLQNAKAMSRLWIPEHFDPRIAQQQREMFYLYSPMGMTQAMPQVLVPASLLDEGNSDLTSSVSTLGDAFLNPNQTDPSPAHTEVTKESVQTLSPLSRDIHRAACDADSDDDKGAEIDSPGYY